MPGSMWMRFAAALVTVVSVVSCSSATHAPASAAKNLSAWTPRPLTESSPTSAAGVECAAITVPMDYAHPDGPTFTVPLIRILSKAAKPRLLMTNPGGPGISGVTDLRSEATYFEKLTDTYTVVSFDPRGVGASAPAIACIDAEQKSAIFNQPSVPVTPQQQERATELAKGIGESCNRQFGEALGHVGTRRCGPGHGRRPGGHGFRQDQLHRLFVWDFRRCVVRRRLSEQSRPLGVGLGTGSADVCMNR